MHKIHLNIFTSILPFFFLISEALLNLWCAIYAHKSVCLRRWAPGIRALANGHSLRSAFCRMSSVLVMNESKDWGHSKGLRKLQKSKGFWELFSQAHSSKFSRFPHSKKHFHKSEWSGHNSYAESGPLAFIRSYHTKNAVTNLIPLGEKNMGT